MKRRRKIEMGAFDGHVTIFVSVYLVRIDHIRMYHTIPSKPRML
jgi:hypothetical protein